MSKGSSEEDGGNDDGKQTQKESVSTVMDLTAPVYTIERNTVLKKVAEIARSQPSIVWPARLADIKVEDITRLLDIVGHKVYEKYG